MSSAPNKPLDELDISKTPSLNSGDAAGWVTAGSHLVYVSWNKCCSIPAVRAYKERFEILAVQAAILKEQTEVEIRSNVHRNCEGLFYERHIDLYFPELERKAHVYIGPHLETKVKNIKIWRREDKPVIVLC